MKTIILSLTLLFSLSANTQIEGGLFLNPNQIRLSATDSTVVATYGAFKEDRYTQVSILSDKLSKNIKNVHQGIYLDTSISQMLIGDVQKYYPTKITEAKIQDPFNATMVITHFGVTAEAESRTNCKVSEAKGEWLKRTGRKLSCFTANSGLCSRLGKLKTSMKSADFMKLSGDLKSCANAIKGLEAVSKDLNEYVRTKEYTDLAKSEAQNIKSYVDYHQKDFDLAKVDEFGQPDTLEFFAGGKLKGTLDLGEVAKSFERIAEASVACSALEDATKKVHQALGIKTVASSGPAAAVPPAPAEGAARRK